MSLRLFNGVTLKGASARAWIDAKMGVRAETDAQRIERVLTALEVQLKSGTSHGRMKARLILTSLVKDGLEKTADRLTIGARIVGVPEREPPPPPVSATKKGPDRPTKARLEALRTAARAKSGFWHPHGPAVRMARAMAADGLGEWLPLRRSFRLADSLFEAYQAGKVAGRREGNAGISTPAMSGGTQNPYAHSELEHAMWAAGFQDGAAEKEGG